MTIPLSFLRHSKRRISVNALVRFRKGMLEVKCLSIVGIAVCSVALLLFFLYGYSQNLLRQRLQDRLLAVATTAATIFDPEDIRAVQGRGDSSAPAFHRLVSQLLRIRSANENIRFSYLMRQTRNPDILAFVADADSLLPREEWDENGNGVIEPDEEIPQPGDFYDARIYPALHDQAFHYPVVDSELRRSGQFCRLQHCSLRS